MLRVLTLILLCFCVVNAFNPDVIIIGGGSAGCAAASEISEDPRIKVLLLEEGLDHSEEMYVTHGFFKTLVNPDTEDNRRRFGYRIDYTKHYYSTEGGSIGYRNLYTNPARLLGGGSSINAELFTRVSADVLKKWNSSLWTYDSTLADWKELENFVDCVSPLCNTTAHGNSGKIKTTALEPDLYLATAMGAIQQSFNLSFNLDTSGYYPHGIGIAHKNIEIDGENVYRQDSYNKLIKPYLGRPNLRVVTSAKVLSITYKQNGKHVVNYLKDGNVIQEKANEAVIVSAGAIASAQILLNSGIGPCDELEEKGVDCVINNTKVGKNLHTNVLYGGVYVSIIGPPPQEKYGSMITATYKSPLTGEPMELSFTSISLGAGSYGIIFELTQLDANYEGYVKLKDSDPLTQPDFSFGMYLNPLDATALAEQALMLRDAMNSIQFPNPYVPGTTFSPFFEVAPGFVNLPPTATLETAISYFIQNAQPGHLMGSLNMHKVVNERLQLINENGVVVPGIYVMDMSIVPTGIDTHCANALANLIGQVGGRLLKESLKKN